MPSHQDDALDAGRAAASPREADGHGLPRPFWRAAGRGVWLAVGIGLVCRLVFGLGYWTGKPLTHDEREYLLLARSLSEGRGFTYTAPDGAPLPGEHFGRAPIYPLLLAAIIVATPGPQPASVAADEPPVSAVTLAVVKIVQAGIGALTILLIASLARSAAGQRAAVAAAALAAVYPPLVSTPAYVFSETAYGALALGAAAWLDRWRRGRGRAWRGVWPGVLAGLGVLTRPAMLLFVAFVSPWLWRRRGIMAALAFLVGAGATIAPWTVHNALTYGRFVLVASEGGITFWTGNHPLATGEGDLAANPELKRANVALRDAHPGLSSEELEPIYYREAVAFIRDHPASWLFLMVRKAFYTVVPIGPSYRLHSPRYLWASVLSYLTVLPLAMLGFVGLRRRSALPEALLLLGAASVAVGLVFFPQERFRIPVIDPLLIVLAGCWWAGDGRHGLEAHQPERRPAG